MKVGTEYEIIKMSCDVCKHKWVAVVEIEYIQYTPNYKEYKLPKELECPQCKCLTEIKENENGENQN